MRASELHSTSVWLHATLQPTYCMPLPAPLQVLTAILQAAKLPGVEIDPRDSGANVKASALVRMDEQLTQFAVRIKCGARVVLVSRGHWPAAPCAKGRAADAVCGE